MSKTKWFVVIKPYKEGPPIRQLGPFVSERHAEKIERAVNINLDHENWSTELVEAPEGLHLLPTFDRPAHAPGEE